ncbi:hypothetical protein K378_04708 [Streptomyces sp. Amel2xB2]|uniref:Uncharacterized protein n=1 Tax=Streptomyces nanshensis TaxID=518642 RepID=A0A1E7L9T2_9ACTN|nr:MULTISPECIES: hypothetical protein [Streptomyces]OEV12914.1 hypothetical protein AN218_05895 [Streptomyces nanshensis]RAJ60011.1 hypothetical protein K378_04708 [Streptomyces sp. Amel2xB2]
MSVYQVSCPARTLILDEEDRLLQDGGLEPEPALWCMLEAGHSGLHLTLAQALRGGDGVPPVTLWLRWAEGAEYDSRREILPLPPCPERFLAGTVQEDACGLPEGHPGRHGFEFGPPISEADITPGWLL